VVGVKLFMFEKQVSTLKNKGINSDFGKLSRVSWNCVVGFTTMALIPYRGALD
jgi:hypothetical protein